MAQVTIVLNIPDEHVAAATAAFTDLAGLRAFVRQAVIDEIKERQVTAARDAAEVGVTAMDITES